MLAFLDWSLFVDDLGRLAVATALGGILGLEREINGHWAGLRTHMMVALGAAVFVVAGGEIAAGGADPIARVIQGVAAGIGFLGAGTILKLGDQERIKGLTTASSIWLAAALGVTAGLALYALAAAALVISMFVLAVLRPVERAFVKYHEQLTGQDGDDRACDTPTDD
jgi:putative Mg2+ transporter-C (MgtC) family protein